MNFPSGTASIEGIQALTMIRMKVIRLLLFLFLCALALRFGAPFRVEAASNEKKERKGTRWDEMDLGPFFSSGLAGKPHVLKSITIKLGRDQQAAVSFDTDMLRLAMAWTNGFVVLPTGRGGLEGVPRPAGGVVLSTPEGPGWANASGEFKDGRRLFDGKPYGPLPREHAKWRGLYLHGRNVILSYTVGSTAVLELPGFDDYALPIFTRTFRIDAGAALALVVCEKAKADLQQEGGMVVVGGAEGRAACTAAAVTGDVDVEWEAEEDRVLLKLPALDRPRQFMVSVWSGEREDLPRFAAALKRDSSVRNPAEMTQGGPGRWGAPLVTKGVAGNKEGPYVVDTLTLPENNPFKSWIRCSGLDFLSDGRAALCSVSGDVWLVGGIDEKLEELTWQRYATGLFQPLGLKVVEDKVYVLGRDQITRLHDLNGDGEADFYENFNNDISITPAYHEFVLDLHTDSEGNFYFAKGGDLGRARIPHHGCVLRVSKDGSKLDVVATGLRAPNGMGLGPNDEITVSDNEGNWVPASRLSLVKPGGFYGHVFTAHRQPEPMEHDAPLCWLPKAIDNSSGGQVWVRSGRWGPFEGDLLHMSYGTCSLFKVMHEEVNGQVHGGVVRFPLRFESGIMRARFSPHDGQLYLCGLSVWQSNAAKEGAFQRVRYTGAPVHMPRQMHVRKEGLEITFTSPLDALEAADAGNYAVEQWNYRWASEYGSKDYKVSNPAQNGRETVEVRSVKLSSDRRTLFLAIPDIQPVMQMRVRYRIKAEDGTPLSSEINLSIHAVPGREAASSR